MIPNKNNLSRNEIIMLTQKNNLSEERVTHPIQVADLAQQLTDPIINDEKIVYKTIIARRAFLHDIGCHFCYGELVNVLGWEAYGIKVPTDDIDYPSRGSAVAKRLRFSEKVVDCVLRHDAGGFTIEECKILKINPLPEKDCAQ